MMDGVFEARKIAFQLPFLRAFIVDFNPKTAFPDFMTRANLELTLSVCAFFPI